MKKRMDKKESMRAHAKRQIFERYGCFCNRDCYFKLLDAVKERQSIIIEKQSNTRLLLKLFMPAKTFEHKRSRISVPLEDNGTIKLYCIWDTKRREFCTFLPWYPTDEALTIERDKLQE